MILNDLILSDVEGYIGICTGCMYYIPMIFQEVEQFALLLPTPF